MNHQKDIFADGSAGSFAPHCDPAVVERIDIRQTVDRDHVGENEIGRFGNNAIVHVVEVTARDGAIIFAEQCSTRGLAVRRRDELLRTLAGNRQLNLFA